MDKLLLHACCGPCSSAIIEEYHKWFDITLFYYNPCITDKEEYDMRADELWRLVEEMGVDVGLTICEFDPQPFYTVSKGLEDMPEGGVRCSGCYTQRLAQTAKYAKSNGFNYFSTTLTISPYKDSAKINVIGSKVGQSLGVFYMPFDFGYLYPRSLELCEKYNLYQQNYCGCEFSRS